MQRRQLILITLAALGLGCGGGSTFLEDGGGSRDGAPDAGADTGGVLPADMAPAPDRGPTCARGQTRCGERCVSVLSDPEHCGGCDRSCQPDELCSNASCLAAPATCADKGCPEDYYCDLAQDKCLPGCGQDAQCDAGERCDVSLNACECQPGHHRCAGKVGCLPDTATDHLVCAGSCAACPTGPQVSGVTCAASACVISACKAGFQVCPSGCCPLQKETVATGNLASTKVLAMAVTDAGAPVVIFAKPHHPAPGTCTVMSAERLGGAWKIGELSTGTSCHDAWLERGDDGKIHAGYRRHYSAKMWTGTYEGPGSWKLYLDWTHAGSRPAAFDGNAAGQPCIVQPDTQPYLHHFGCATKTPSADSWWDLLSPIGDAKSTYTDSAADLQMKGSTPHVVYLRGKGQRPTYARRNAGVWTEEQVADVESHTPAIVLDSKGSPLIAFDGGSAGVKLARRQTNGTWSVEVVYDTQRSAMVSLAIDSADNPVVGHRLGMSTEVVISRKANSGWQHATVGAFRAYAMDVDASGKVHVAAMADDEVVYFHE